MARDPLLPNAGIVARREYRDRIRSPFFIVATIVLMTLALGVALAPIGIRYMDRLTVTRILVVADDATLGQRAVAVADSILNVPPSGVDPAVWEKAFFVDLSADAAAADRALVEGDVAGVMIVDRAPDQRLEITYRTNGPPNGVRSQLIGFAAIAVGILDWTATLPPGSQLAPFQEPTFTIDPINVPTNGRGVAFDPQEIAGRAFLGVVFVVLLFLTVIIYGMWVATGVAAEKSSRVMELMISAASPRQLLTGKVVGIGGAGLTQYVAIAVPALIVVALQDRIAEAIMGPAGASAPIVGLTPGLLLGYGVFFLLGFALFALIYAAMGSFVSRPDDLQTLSLPLSLVAMAGYLTAVVTLSGGSGAFTTIASFVPPFSPFVMLARLMVEAVAPWEIALSIGILLVTIVVVAVAATRMYEAGVLLYGQRPGLRTFIAAARRAG